MEPNQPSSREETPFAQSKPTLNLAKAQSLKQQLEAQQNLPLGIIGGIVAAAVGAALWAAITVATKYQIGWMAIGVGFLVGGAVRSLGKGVSKNFGVLGAICALLGCAVGNLLSMCGFVAISQGVPFFKVTTAVITHPAAIVDLFKLSFQPMDIVFYAIAVYEGYRFSFRQITEQDLMALYHDQPESQTEPSLESEV